jgi:spore coat polysaccharide biosynthesis predicted glycosyltransferase SpsG
MGLPSVVGVLSEDQRGVAQSLEERGTALNLGWFDRVNQKDIANALVAVLSDVARRKTMSLRGREMVDGLGASRVVERMVRIGGCEEERRPSAQPGGAGSPG